MRLREENVRGRGGRWANVRLREGGKNGLSLGFTLGFGFDWGWGYDNFMDFTNDRRRCTKDLNHDDMAC